MEKIELEYIFKVSPKLLFNRLSTAGGLSEWFCDDVFESDGIFTFVWGETKDQAKLLSLKPMNSVKFKWLENEDEDSYFEFRIETLELSNEISLIVTDFAPEDEKDEIINLWDTQIGNLKSTLGI